MYFERLAVAVADANKLSASIELAERLNVPLVEIGSADLTIQANYFLSYRDNCLKLLDVQTLKKGGLAVEIEPRQGEQRSYPAPKNGLLAMAIGKKTHTVIDATTGWAQDSLSIFRMGYDIQCIERSPVMVELIQDGFARLAQKSWMQNRQLQAPKLLIGNAIELLSSLPEQPDCIYIDPMFPPKRKKTALSKKAMTILRDILGDDLDRNDLFTAAMQAAGKRVVVKCPDDAEVLAGKPSQSFQGKLLRYDVYLK